MSFDPAVFGAGFHRFVQNEYLRFGFLSPVFHVLTAIAFCIILIFGNRVRRYITAYFTVNWVFLAGYWGVFGIMYWSSIGIIYTGVYIAAPILLFLILIQWIKEWKHPRINLDLSLTARLFICLPIIAWGFWYPSYIYKEGFSLSLNDLASSYYGLMPCPTTMVVLALLALNYPETNTRLYNLMTAYALCIGTATVASGWLPDIPFIILGLYTFILHMTYRSRRLKRIHKEVFQP